MYGMEPLSPQSHIKTPHGEFSPCTVSVTQQMLLKNFLRPDEVRQRFSKPVQEESVIHMLVIGDLLCFI
jgi:hypothetical protein